MGERPLLPFRLLLLYVCVCVCACMHTSTLDSNQQHHSLSLSLSNPLLSSPFAAISIPRGYLGKAEALNTGRTEGRDEGGRQKGDEYFFLWRGLHIVVE